MSTPELSLFATCAFLFFILALLPVPWHINSFNAGLAALILWVSLSCFILFVGSVAQTAPVWCDIATKLLIGACVGVPASLLCMSRRLHDLIRDPDSIVTRKFLYSIWVDISLAFVLPVVVIFLHITFQEHRYVVYEEAGCFPSIFPSVLSYVILFSWPILFSSWSLIYSGLTFWTLRAQNYELPELLYVTGSVTSATFLRLFACSVSSVICTLSVGIFLLYSSVHKVALRAFSSMDRDFDRIITVPQSHWQADTRLRGLIELRWACPSLALVIFVLMAFAPEMRLRYSLLLRSLMSRVNSKDTESSSFQCQEVPDGTLPIFIPQNPASLDTNGPRTSVAGMYARTSLVPSTARNSLHPSTARNSLVPSTTRNSLVPSTARNSTVPSTARSSLAGTPLPPSPRILEWPTYHPCGTPSPTPTNASISESIGSIPSESGSDYSESADWGKAGMQQGEQHPTCSTKTSYASCAPCEDVRPCH